QKKAFETNSSIRFVQDSTYPFWIDDLPFPFNSGFQLQNVKTALLAIDGLSKKEEISIDQKLFVRALENISKNTGYQKRIEIVHENPRVILDVSHNLEGIKATLFLLQNTFKGNLFIIYGSSSDKNYHEIIESFPGNSKVCLTPFHSERSWTFQALSEIKKENSEREIELFNDVNLAISSCIQRSSAEDTILVFGSFFLIQDITLDFKNPGI
ncbi:MAG: glutamate ligase domain-containing protein, partial [Bacteroidota bacterium]